jgi:hypothetical protein
MSRVLLVNIILTGRTGTEVVCCETARGLRDRNHDVAVYIQRGGRTADELRVEGFQVVTDLQELKVTPDIIQANQTYPLLEAVTRFPTVPAISICHDSTVWFNEPIDLPVIHRHIAVDLACRDRIITRLPHLHDHTDLLHNAVDLGRFLQRGPLPAKPNHALIITKNAKYLEALRTACEQCGLEVDVIGPAVDNEVDDLPTRLRNYDLVFATARSALEAIATGCAVIVVGGHGLAGLVTRANVSSWRENNFGLRLLSRAISPEAVVAEIDHYDAADARSASAFVREHSSLKRYLDRLEVIHQEVMRREPVNDGLLFLRMGQAARALVQAQATQSENDWTNAWRDRELAFQTRSAAREAERTTDFERRLTGLRAQFEAQARQREAEFRAEVEEQTLQREAAFQAEFEAQARQREATFQAEFDAYRDWVAPRNIGRRTIYKVRRVLSGLLFPRNNDT